MNRKSGLTAYDRAKKANQTPKFIIVTGGDFMACSELAVRIEKKLYDKGRMVYFADSTDLRDNFPFTLENGREADIKRAGNAASLINEAGVIFITSLHGLSAVEESTLKAINKRHETVIVNAEKNSDAGDEEVFEEAVKKIQETFSHLNEVLEYYL
jgi:adenylylsulfate kinase-like enzyme